MPMSNMFDHKYPITNLHELDMTMTNKEVDKFSALLHDLVNGKLTEALDKYFNSFMINAIYHEDIREIELKKEITISDGAHVYNAGDETMSIGG